MLNIAVAHKAEAQPFVHGLVMRKETHESGYDVFVCDQAQLFICGQGLRNMQKLVEILLASKKPVATKWLNFGVAGSAGANPGDLVWIEQVSDEAQQRTIGLSVPLNATLPQLSGMSVSRIRSTYSGRQVYDMELMALAAGLKKCKTMATLSAIKLISDGPEQPHACLTKNVLASLIEKSTPDLLQSLNMLMQ